MNNLFTDDELGLHPSPKNFQSVGSYKTERLSLAESKKLKEY